MRAVVVRAPVPESVAHATAACAALRSSGFEVREFEVRDRPRQTRATPRPLRVAQRVAWNADDRRRAAAARRAVEGMHEGEPLLVFGAAAFRLVPGLADAVRRRRPRLVLVDAGAGEDTEEAAAFVAARAARVLRAGGRAEDAAATGRAAAAAAIPVVPVYGLCYRFRDVYARAVDSLLATEIVPLRVHVAQNGAEGDGDLTARCREDVAAGRVAGHVRYADNLYGTALADAYLRVFPPPRDADVVVLTDLDIEIPPSGRRWLFDALDRLRAHPDLQIVSVDFDLSNWDPGVARGHVVAPPSSWDATRRVFRVPSGLWLSVIRRSLLDEYLAGPRPLADKFLYAHIARTVHRGTYGRLPIACRHLSWDVQRVDHGYRERKYAEFYDAVYRRHKVGDHEVVRVGATPAGAAGA